LFKRFTSGKFISIKIIPTTEAGAKSIIHSLRFTNSSGYDEIMVKVKLSLCLFLIECHAMKAYWGVDV
jgi:hypothetical protein